MIFCNFIRKPNDFQDLSLKAVASQVPRLNSMIPDDMVKSEFATAAIWWCPSPEKSNEVGCLSRLSHPWLAYFRREIGASSGCKNH